MRQEPRAYCCLYCYSYTEKARLMRSLVRAACTQPVHHAPAPRTCGMCSNGLHHSNFELRYPAALSVETILYMQKQMMQCKMQENKTHVPKH